MSTDTSKTKEGQVAPAAPAEKPEEEGPGRIYLVSYPKIVFLYPTFVMALLTGIAMSFAIKDYPDATKEFQKGMSLAFLCILGVNLVVLSLDFPRTTSLTLFFLAVAIVLGGVLLFTFYPNLLPSFLGVLGSLRPVANAQFFYLIAGILGVIYLIVLVSVQFDYWEVRPNELLHHHGFLSNLERFPAQNIRVEKEITDIFEYVLLRSGRLILTAQGSARPIVLENVLFIGQKEQALTKMLAALQVSVRRET